MVGYLKLIDLDYNSLPIFINTNFVEGPPVKANIYEKAGWLWFQNRGFNVLEYHISQKPDYLIADKKGNELWYEVKGREIFTIDKKAKVLRVPTIRLQNINDEMISYYLIVIFDNFTNLFSFYPIKRDILKKLAGDNPTTFQLYKLFSHIGFTKTFYKAADVDISEREFIPRQKYICKQKKCI
jgi:hypothetical protein